MAEGTRSSGQQEPRRFLVDPAQFGKDASTPWRPLVAGERVPEQVAAYWQHLAVCTLREMFPTQLVEELATRLGKGNAVYVRRQVSGEYRTSIEDLIGWAIAFDDITLLPQIDSIGELSPPSGPA